MTEILINELSLSGQFASTDEFIGGGALINFVVVLNEIKKTESLLYKKYDFFSSMITKNVTVYDILKGSISRQYDEIRKFKSNLACLFDDPYWEKNQKHSADVMYQYNGNCVTGQSLAEACERDKIVISFLHPDFSLNQLLIQKEETGVFLDNLLNQENYFEVAEKRNPIESWDGLIKYITERYTSMELTEDAKKNIKKETFEAGIKDEIISRLDILDKMINAKSEASFLQLRKEYCEGDRAWFSDESDTRKNDLRNKLTFLINGKKVLCSYHGKINMRTFRIHLSSSPKRNEKLYIAYIGGKIL